MWVFKCYLLLSNCVLSCCENKKKLTTTQYTDAQAILRPYLNWCMLILPLQITHKHKLSSFLMWNININIKYTIFKPHTLLLNFSTLYYGDMLVWLSQVYYCRYKRANYTIYLNMDVNMFGSFSHVTTMTLGTRTERRDWDINQGEFYQSDSHQKSMTDIFNLPFQMTQMLWCSRPPNWWLCYKDRWSNNECKGCTRMSIRRS
jgi:hypothetical protein